MLKDQNKTMAEEIKSKDIEIATLTNANPSTKGPVTNPSTKPALTREVRHCVTMLNVHATVSLLE
jgi:hypothetical protein